MSTTPFEPSGSAGSFVLRRATPADVVAIMQIESSTFGTDAWSPATMAADVANAHTVYLVAHDPTQPTLLAGYAGLLAPRGSGDADIQTIAVAEPFRRRGLGRELMVSLIAEARDRRATSVFLEVRADNPNAEALYASLGFERIAVREKYYQPDGVDAHIMRLTGLK